MHKYDRESPGVSLLTDLFYSFNDKKNHITLEKPLLCAIKAQRTTRAVSVGKQHSSDFHHFTFSFVSIHSRCLIFLH